MNTLHFALSLAAATGTAATGAVHADVLHGSAGLSASMMGYASAQDRDVALRAGPSSLPGIGESIGEGAAPTGHVISHRGAVFTEWVRAGDRGGAPLFGDVPYAPAQNDRYDSTVRAAQTTPYLGYGQYSFLFDLGGNVARASLGRNASGPSLTPASQGALDRELAQLRDGIRRARFTPQVSLGMRVRF